MTITIQQAVTKHNEGKLEEAERLYREILKIEPTLFEIHNNLGVISCKTNRPEEAEASYKKAIELNPSYAAAYFNLGDLLSGLKRFDEAKIKYKIAIKLKPNFIEAHNNLGNIQKELGKLDEAENSYKKAIEFKPDYEAAHYNLGNLLKKLSRFEEAEASYKKAIELKPDYVEARYNLGITLHTLKQYKKAADEFLLMNYKSSQSYLLKCWFKLNDKINFTIQLDKMLEQGKNNAVIGSLISRSKIRYGVQKQNPFCNEPLNYVLKTDITKICDFKNIFIQTAKNILNNNVTLHKTQTLLTNGTQTSNNLFSQKNDLIEKMKNIIHLEIEKYFAHFKDSEEGFIKNWPKPYTLNGWLVNMKSGGKLSPHMHDYGWVSGSIYINVPQKKTVDSGNLVACLDDNEDENNPKKIIDVVTGSICMFPSSLFHYTIPFDADEERIVLAFDVVPK